MAFLFASGCCDSPGRCQSSRDHPLKQVSSTSVGADAHEDDPNPKTPEWMKDTGAPMLGVQACDSDEGAHQKPDADDLQLASPGWVYDTIEETPPARTPPPPFKNLRKDEAGRNWYAAGPAHRNTLSDHMARQAAENVEVFEMPSPSWVYDKREETQEGTHMWLPLLTNSWNSPLGGQKKSPIEIQAAITKSKRIDFDRSDIQTEEVEAEIQTLMTAYAHTEQEEEEVSVTDFGRYTQRYREKERESHRDNTIPTLPTPPH